MKQWFVLYGNRAVRAVDKPVFIYEKDIFSALDQYKRIVNKKRHWHAYMKMPDIKLLTKEQTGRLERLIRKEREISMSQAKNTWYYPDLEGLAYLNLIDIGQN